MICDECRREHVITGAVLVDGCLVPLPWLEVLAEMLCRHGKLGIPVAPEGDDGPGPEFGPEVRNP